MERERDGERERERERSDQSVGESSQGPDANLSKQNFLRVS